MTIKKNNNYSNLSKIELLSKCNELGIKRCKSKKKEELINLIKNKSEENIMSIPTKYNVLSLFSGIGGMDMGFGGDVIVHKSSIAKDFKNSIQNNYKIKNFVKLKSLNFKVIFQNDILEGAKNICELNNTANNYIIKSLYDLVYERYKFPNADVIIGGFPCNDFSHAGKRKGFDSKITHNLKDQYSEDNSRGMLYKSFVSVVQQIKPKIFVAENVYGLLTMKNAPIKQIIRDFEDLNYNVAYEVIKSNEYGVPQNRWRVIIIGISKNRKNTILQTGWNNVTKNKLTCNIRPYFEHLAEPDISEDISQQIYSKAKKLNKGQGQIEIKLDSISPTIRAEHHGNIEFRRHKNSVNKNENQLQERRLTLREVGLIQTFPPNFIFSKKKEMTSYKYIGNAIPPLLAYLIADKVEELLINYF